MADENWQKVRKIFDAALRQLPEERQQFVGEICGEDKQLLAEVESLLSSLDSAESFMETPAVAEIAEAIGGSERKLEKGQFLGRYEIIEQIGTGGMGEVYLATDQKLDRQVAIKILNEKFSQDNSNLKRFMQEAKSASALNHPNILTIYEFGEAENVHFIVSEFIEGETLREIIRESKLELSEILDISIQITEALSAAHKVHLVHRDIKPENVMIRPDGYVKILDFGLAKLIQSKQPFVGLEAEDAKQNNTTKGVIMGTVNYMSPQQAKGEKVDERTDIFSLGVVIYEMITGRTPFAGDSMSETFANLINQEPQPLSHFAPNVPDELQGIISKMLSKNEDERYQTMNYLISDLKDLKENFKTEKRLEKSLHPEDNNETGKITVTTNREKKETFLTDWNFTLAFKHHRKKIIIGFCVVIICSVLSMSFYRFSKSENTREPFRQIRLKRVTNIGNVGKVALSPDGNLIVYETKEKEGVSLWVRQIEMSNSINLLPLKKGDITFLTFSPDGKLVYYGFFSGYDSTAVLYSVPALGGAIHKIKTNLATNFMSFAPDGKHYAQVTSNLGLGEKALVINSLDNNEEIRLAVRKSPSSFNILGQFGSWSPDGKTIAIISNDIDANGQFSTLVSVNTKDGTEKPLSAKRWNELNGVQWLKDGSGLLVVGSDAQQAQSQIWFISSADGEARVLTYDLNDYSYIGVTTNGKQIVSVQESRTSSIWLGTIGQNANDFKEVISETGTLDTIALTANDNIIFRSNTDGKPNLWTIRTDGSERKQLTVDAEVDGRGLCVAPDAKQIVFPSRKAGKVNLWSVDVNGGDARQLTFGDGEFFPTCLPDNREVIYQKGSGYGIKSTLWKISLDGGDPIQLTDYYAIRPALSFDGKHIAFFYITKDKWRIGIISSNGGKIEQNFDVPDGVLDRNLRWSPDGQSLFYIANDGNVGNVWSLPMNGQLPKQLTKFNSHLLADFIPTQHDNEVVLTRTVKLSDVVIISEE